jgi:hypothetical protein
MGWAQLYITIIPGNLMQRLRGSWLQARLGKNLSEIPFEQVSQEWKFRLVIPAMQEA